MIRLLGAVAFLLVLVSSAGAETATLYTARVPGGAGLTDAELEATARAHGAVETVTLGADGAVTRAIVTPGEPGLGAPGFTSKTEAYAEAAKGAKSATVKGGTLKWTQGAPGGDLVTEAYLGDQLAYTEYRVHGADGRLAHLRLNFANGSALYQVYDYASSAAGGALKGAGTTTAAASKPGGISKALQTANVQFTAPPEGIDYTYDTGYWPGGGSSPGGFPVQVRIGLAATANYSAQVAGAFDYNKPNLAPGLASGSWGFDFGAEVVFKAAFDIGVIDPIEIDVPFVPNFDLRAEDTENFNSFLLDSTSTLDDTTPRTTLFTYDLGDLILGGLDLPSWLPIEAGAALDVAVNANGTLTCDSIGLTDGTTFTGEGQQLPVTVPFSGYDTTATYNETAALEVRLDLFPGIYIGVLGVEYTLPILEFDWSPIEGPRDFAFSTSSFSLQFEPGEGEGEGEGGTEGEGEGEGEGEDNSSDWFTQPFSGAVDLAGSAVYFNPAANVNGFTACSAGASGYPVSPTPGTLLPLEDDGILAVNLNNSVTFDGTAYDRLYICSNGFVSFGAGTATANASLAEHFELPRVSGFFADLDPSAGGTIRLRTMDDRYVVTYDEVPVKGTGATASFQIIIAVDGTIGITWLNVPETANAIAGLSRGAGLAPAFAASDLTSYAPCLENGCLPIALDTAGALAALYASGFVETDPVTADFDANGIVDTAHLALLDEVLARGASCVAFDAFAANYALVSPAVDALPAFLWETLPAESVKRAAAGLMTLGDAASVQLGASAVGLVGGSVEAASADTSAAGVLGVLGDADGDLVCNLGEYNAAANVAAFVAAALDAAQTNSGAGCGGEEGEGAAEGEGEGEGEIEGEGEGQPEGEGEGINYTCELANPDPVPGAREFGIEGGAGSFQIVRTNEVCIDPVFVSSDEDFVTILSGSSDYTVLYAVAPNPGPARVAIITADGFFGAMTHLVIQAGTGGEGEGEGEGTNDNAHDADRDGSGTISLSELLRVVQFYNSSGYHCDASGEDGFAPGPGAQDCTAHSSDYNPQNWVIALSELLRLIQFYNSGGYHPCPGEGTEDGYCPGPAA